MSKTDPSESDGTSVRSPCVQVCSIDPKSGECRGCGRTLAEIAGWIRFTPVEKRAVLDRLAHRAG